MKYLILLFVLFAANSAFATGGPPSCPPGHDNIDSCEDGGGGEQGPPGEDGADGIDGIDGKDGRDGIDGLNGIDGIVDYQRVTTTINKNFRTWRNYLAAQSAIQIHLPQDSSQRVSVSGSTIEGTTGFGLGYAYKFDRDDNLSITAGIGSSGGEEVGVLSVGFEFGSSRSTKSYSYDDSRLERRLDVLERSFQRQKSLWDEDAQRCAADLDRVEQKNDRIEERFMECLRK